MYTDPTRDIYYFLSKFHVNPQCNKIKILLQRVKANINPKLLQSEPKQKEDQYKTVYTVEYTKKEVGADAEYAPRPIPLRNVDYMRTMQEKVPGI